MKSAAADDARRDHICLVEGTCMLKIMQSLERVFGVEEVRAHCDIPCGIYDPHQAQIAALTVIRMIDLAAEMKGSHAPDAPEYLNNMPRYIMIKEEHAELVKREVRVIFGDYIKQEQLEKFPELPGLMHKILQLGSKSRQTMDRQAACDLLEAVNRFAEIFWATKNIATRRVKAPYKPGEEIVYPEL
jgi:nickel superoxide dismutase